MNWSTIYYSVLRERRGFPDPLSTIRLSDIEIATKRQRQDSVPKSSSRWK